MFYRAISLALVAVLLHGSIAAQDQPPSPPQTADKMQRVLRKAQEKDKAVKVISNRKIGKQRKFSGKVSEISDAGFTLTDQKTATATKFAYKDVQEVKQKGMSKSWIITLVVIAGVVVAAIIVGETITGGD